MALVNVIKKKKENRVDDAWINGERDIFLSFKFSANLNNCGFLIKNLATKLNYFKRFYYEFLIK